MKDEQHKEDYNLESLFQRLKDFRSPSKTCFLCGSSLLEKNSTEEHVIPLWAQNRFELLNQYLILLNGSKIPYRQLTVPCCEDCNTFHLRPLEDSLSSTVSEGRKAVQALGKRLLYLWLGKIFYGILYKELLLLLDRSDSNKGMIITPQIIDCYEMHRFLLQQVRGIVKTVDFNPGSIFVFSMQSLPQRRMEWDLCDNVDSTFIGCRIGKVGIIGILADGGAQQPFEEAYADILDLDLHPVQFRELCAQFSYRSTLITRTPKYITAQGVPHVTHQLPLGGMSARPIFEGWNLANYAQFLAKYLNEDVSNIYSPPDKVLTWLHTPDGKAHFLNFKEFPVLPYTR